LNTNSLSKLLARSGLVLLALYGVVVLFDVLPPRFLQADWILNFAITLSNSISIPLVGIALITIGSYIAPSGQAKLQIRISRLSAILSLLFLLIQPMLVFAVWKNLRELSTFNSEQVNLIKAKAAQLSNAIETAPTFEELQARMASLQGPVIPDKARSIALPGLKKQLLDAVRNAQTSFPTRLNTPASDAYKGVYKRIARTSILSLLGTIGFGILAWNPITDKNILLTYLKSIGLFGITPESIYNSITSMKSKKLRDADLNEIRKSALRHQRQTKKAEAQQLRGMKRRQMAEQKQAEKMRLERERILDMERKMERKQELERERNRDREP